MSVVVHTYDTNSQEVKGQDKKISVIKTLSIFFLKVLSYIGRNQFFLLW